MCDKFTQELSFSNGWNEEVQAMAALGRFLFWQKQWLTVRLWTNHSIFLGFSQQNYKIIKRQKKKSIKSSDFTEKQIILWAQLVNKWQKQQDETWV